MFAANQDGTVAFDPGMGCKAVYGRAHANAQVARDATACEQVMQQQRLAQTGSRPRRAPGGDADDACNAVREYVRILYCASGM